MIRITQYRWLQPFPVLDHAWGHDLQWEGAIVESLRRGAAAPRSLSVHEAVPGDGYTGEGSWEVAEERAKDADRSGSPFLNDFAIARRLPARKLLKEAWAEFLQSLEEKRALQKASEAERQAAMAEEEAEQAKRREQRRLQKEAQAAEWERIERELVKVKAQAKATAEAERRRRLAAIAEIERRQREANLDQEQFRLERQAILHSEWRCKTCGAEIKVQLQRGKYVLQCAACLIVRTPDHAALVRLIAA